MIKLVKEKQLSLLLNVSNYNMEEWDKLWLSSSLFNFIVIKISCSFIIHHSDAYLDAKISFVLFVDLEDIFHGKCLAYDLFKLNRTLLIFYDNHVWLNEIAEIEIAKSWAITFYKWCCKTAKLSFNNFSSVLMAPTPIHSLSLLKLEKELNFSLSISKKNHVMCVNHLALCE